MKRDLLLFQLGKVIDFPGSETTNRQVSKIREKRSKTKINSLERICCPVVLSRQFQGDSLLDQHYENQNFANDAFSRIDTIRPIPFISPLRWNKRRIHRGSNQLLPHLISFTKMIFHNLLIVLSGFTSSRCVNPLD
jgi:hypothetical protein